MKCWRRRLRRYCLVVVVIALVCLATFYLMTVSKLVIVVN